jgi:DNA-nicking Smr family endonuclease
MDRGSEGRRSRALTALDLELWSAVTADVKPFRERPIVPKPVAHPVSARGAEVPAAPRHAPPPHKRAEPPMTIDETTRRKLKRGRLDVDVKLDLHGLRQQEAHAALHDFLRSAQARGARLAIIVTGKGFGRADGGVLRRLAPLWLQGPGLRDIVVGYGEAARQHGGEGALYVRLRRADRSSGAGRV